MKKQKVRVLNLSELTENELIAMMNDNNMDAAELFAILESLFEMFSCSLKFSQVVFKYGHEHHQDFVPTFLRHAATSNGFNPKELVDVLRNINPNSSSIH